MPRYASVERQKEEEERHRQEILGAAAKVLVEQGLHAATMRDVARAARFSIGKIYQHFPNKAVLFQELLDHYVDEAVEIVESSLGGPGRIAERSERAVHEILEFSHRNPLFFRLLVNETLGFELRMQTQFGKTIAAKYARMIRAGVGVFEEGLESGEVRGGTAEELTLKLAGIFNAVVTAETLRPAARPVAEITDLILRLFWEGARGDRVPAERKKRR
jgi:AcrR family transcriptional regulator